jgi:hypothetical protein
MQRKTWLGWRPAVVLALAAGLTACGGGGDSVNATAPAAKATIPVANSAKPAFSFDISYANAGRYYLADRNNAAVDVVDTHTNTLIAQIQGTGSNAFTGFNANTDFAGPDGLVGIPGTNILYVGDVNNVKVIDTAQQKVINTIKISSAGHRVDEGCYDPDDDIVMFASPGETPPFVTFIKNSSQTLLTPTSNLTFATSSGLEACVYDAKSKRFLINNDGTPANPNGEVDVITAASVVAGTPAVSAVYPLGNCSPTGLALGPGNDMLVGCDEAAGQPLNSLILDRTNGATVATIKFAGVDQVEYDPQSNRYFMPARHETASGTAASSGFTPLLGVVDAGAHVLVQQIPVGTGVHSVAIDNVTDQVYVPFQPSATVPNGGILVFSAQ